MSDPVEDEFLLKLRQAPNDDEVRLVYADWLEEHGRTDEGRFLREQVSLASLAPEDPRFEQATKALRKLAQRIVPHWRSVVARAPIEGCEIRFDFACPKKWEGLTPIDLGDDVRFCPACKKNVYYTQTVEEASRHALEGRCVVVDLVQIRRPNDLRPAPPPVLRTAGIPITPPPQLARK